MIANKNAQLHLKLAVPATAGSTSGARVEICCSLIAQVAQHAADAIVNPNNTLVRQKFAKKCKN